MTRTAGLLAAAVGVATVVYVLWQYGMGTSYLAGYADAFADLPVR